MKPTALALLLVPLLGAPDVGADVITVGPSGAFAAAGFNLVGVDPLFVDPAADDYRVGLLSGVANGRVDIGALEGEE